jgi:hypothetical protein
MVVQIGVKMADRIADGLLPRPDVSQERAAPYVVRLAQIRRPLRLGHEGRIKLIVNH